MTTLLANRSIAPVRHLKIVGGNAYAGARRPSRDPKSNRWANVLTLAILLVALSHPFQPDADSAIIVAPATEAAPAKISVGIVGYFPTQYPQPAGDGAEQRMPTF